MLLDILWGIWQFLISGTGIFISLLLELALIIWALFRPEKQKTEILSKDSSIKSIPEPPLDLALKQMATDDVQRLSDRVAAFSGRSYIQSSVERPYVVFEFHVANMSVLPIEIITARDGIIKMDNTPLTLIYEILNAGTLLHGDTRLIQVRQYLTEQDVRAIREWDKSDTIAFDFMGLNVWVLAKSWYGLESPRARLRLPQFVWLPACEFKNE